MRERETVAISIPTDLIEKVDKDRGLVPRSRFIESLLTEAYEHQQKERT